METPKETPPPETIKETISAKYKFTPEERISIAENLVRFMSERDQIESELSSAKNQFKVRLESNQGDIDLSANKLRDGFEMRDTPAIVLFNHPSKGRKTYINDSNGETIREEAMNYSDQERPLFRNADGSDATKPASAPEKPAEAPATSEPGETSVGAALDAAAASTDAPRIVLDLDAPDWEHKALTKAFKTRAKAAGWNAAQISLVTDRLKESSNVDAMKDTLRPHVVAPFSEPFVPADPGMPEDPAAPSAEEASEWTAEESDEPAPFAPEEVQD